MADLDTTSKRRSSIAISLYSMAPSVLPDGTIGDADRQVAGYGYFGIAVGAPAGGGSNPNPSAGTLRDVQTITNRAFDSTNNILNVTTV